MKFNDLYNLYNKLEQVRLATISDEDALKLYRLRRRLNPIISEFEEFKSHVEKTQQPSNYEELKEKFIELNKLEKPERDSILGELETYRKRVQRMLENEYSEKEIDIFIEDSEKISEASQVAIIRENGWKMEEIKPLELIFY